MSDRLRQLLKVFDKKHCSCLKEAKGHPNEEMLACYADNRLAEQDAKNISDHLAACASCADALLTQLRIANGKNYSVSAELLARLKAIAGTAGNSAFEIVLKNAEKIFEIIYTNGQVLLGQEMIPAQDLRSRQIKDFRDTVSIVKDIENIRLEIKVDSTSAGYFNVTVSAKNKKTSKILKDYRVTLLKADAELESYIIERCAVTFEHVSLGRYNIDISSQESKLASVTLDIKI
ncbi:MAG: hypothetical protein NTY47_08820 [Candidatus Omnitrophica bacterium]|nr:hypothetical protein [Candidatus Omnitrophota bacterium]